MIYVYNDEIFDTLLCVKEPQKAIVMDTKQNGDITIIFNGDEIVGYNIKNASKLFDIPFSGVLLEANELFENQVLQYIEKEIAMTVADGSLMQNFIIGHVLECTPHKDSNKLSVCQINLGDTTEQIVCGASNIAAGQKVVVATIGCMMPTGLIIEPGVLRGEKSNGMVCSGRELGLDEKYQTPGILVLPEDAIAGESFFAYLTKGAF